MVKLYAKKRSHKQSCKSVLCNMYATGGYSNITSFFLFQQSIIYMDRRSSHAHILIIVGWLVSVSKYMDTIEIQENNYNLRSRVESGEWRVVATGLLQWASDNRQWSTDKDSMEDWPFYIQYLLNKLVNLINQLVLSFRYWNKQVKVD